MRPRFARALRAASLAALVLATSTLVLALLAVPAPAAPAPPVQDAAVGKPPVPFKHGAHVPFSWWTLDEVERDCRGCHAYDHEDGKGRDPSPTICARCHFGYDDPSTRLPRRSLRPVASPGFENGLSALRLASGSAFRHYTPGQPGGGHWSLACKDCHRLEENARGVPEGMPIPRGTGFCMECHDPARSESESPARARAITPEVNRRHCAGLDRSPRMGPDFAKRFRHDEHLSPGQLADASTCAECHADVPTADGATLGEKAITLNSCGKCHLSTTGALAFLVESVSTPSRSALCFPHARHLSDAARTKEPSIADGGCFACHAYDSSLGTYDLRPATDPAAAFGNYQACVQCHSHKDWIVERHGEVDDCVGCHAAVEGGDMKTNRPRVTVTRRDPDVFVISRQAHPFITTEGAADAAPDTVDRDCKKCHVAAVRDLPSRIAEKRFDHASHLPLRPTTADCESCHKSKINATDAAGEITDLYDASVCKTCHRGVERIEARYSTPTELAPVETMLFSHRVHLAAKKTNGEDHGCLDCHAGADLAPGKELGYLAGVRECTGCHNHGEFAAVTGDHTQAKVESCDRCHKHGVPRKDVPITTTRPRIGGLAKLAGNSQHHPPGESCGTCHDPALATVTIDREHEDHFFGADKYPGNDFHQATARMFNRDKVRDNLPGTSDAEHRECFLCHWDQLQEPGRRSPRFRSLSARQIREQFGARPAGFPGKDFPTQ